MALATRAQLSVEGALAVGGYRVEVIVSTLDLLTQVAVAHPCVNPHMNRKCLSDKRYACFEESN
ncbi:MAG: hypothetical protein M3447_08950 [Acidobacteriota bacterium]|nr:hypothetical protein [Acidobacteriota bacterium]